MDVMGVGHQQITCRWDKPWIPINQFLNHKILSSGGTDLTTYFKDNEKFRLLSMCPIPTQCITVLGALLWSHWIPQWEPPWGVVIDIHTLKMREQRLKESKYCPKVKWVERAKIKVPIEFMYFSRLCLFSLHISISVNKKREWVTHMTSDSPMQTPDQSWESCSSSLSLTNTSSHPHLLGSLFHPLKPSPHEKKPVFLMFMNWGLEETTCMRKCSLLLSCVFFYSIPKLIALFNSLVQYFTFINSMN